MIEATWIPVILSVLLDPVRDCFTVLSKRWGLAVARTLPYVQGHNADGVVGSAVSC